MPRWRAATTPGPLAADRYARCHRRRRLGPAPFWRQLA